MLTKEIIELYREFNFCLNIPHPTLFELCILLRLISYRLRFLNVATARTIFIFLICSIALNNKITST